MGSSSSTKLLCCSPHRPTAPLPVPPRISIKRSESGETVITARCVLSDNAVSHHHTSFSYVLFMHFYVNRSLKMKRRVSIKVICIWSPHRPPLQRQQALWCAGTNTHKCMWLNIVSYYCLLAALSEVNSESLSLWASLSCTSEARAWIECFWFFGFLAERYLGDLFQTVTLVKLI